MIVIVDYGIGNLGSIRNMLKSVGVPAAISSNEEEIENADKLILPGVGAYDTGMRHLLDSSNSTARPLAGIFTDRQVEVVEALRRGKANKIIAYELNLRESTVKVHVRNIMKKVKATNRTEVVFKLNDLCQTSLSA